MPMQPQDRKAELVRRGVKQSEIARQTGFSGPYVHEVIRGTRRSAVIEQAVAEKLGMPVEEVFGAVAAA